MRLALFTLGVILLLVIFAPLLAPSDPLRIDEEALMVAPFQSPQHPLGTDRLGRDVLSRALYGGQHTLMIAGGATLLAVTIGLMFGLLAGAGNWADRIISTLLNALLAIPGLILAFVVLTLLGRGEISLALATGIAQVAPYARVVRGAVIGTESATYVEAAEALGATRGRILLRHILPNISTTLLAYGAAVFSYCILNSAALSFLGFGAEPGTPDWGVMLAEGRAGFRTAPWVSFVPGVLITLVVAAVNRISNE
jgi:peptide/nickel transport system permease protein